MQCSFLIRILFFLTSLAVTLPVSSQVVNVASAYRENGLVEHYATNVRVIPNGGNIFPDILKNISSARRSVYVEFYKIWNDSIGNTLMTLLADKAREGLDVRVIYDAFGNSGKKPGYSKEYVNSIKDRGVKIVGFDPMRFPYVNHALHRDHRKMVILDDSIVYTGGLNVADYYIKGRPELGEWRDMFICMGGSVTRAYRRLFMEMWQKCTGETSVDNANASEASHGEPVYVASREPGKLSAAMRKAYCASIDGASHHVVIVNPYPLHCRSVRKSLYAALKRGVKVEYMVSYVSDNRLMTDMTGVEMRRLQKRGANIYLYTKGFHHDKILLVDDTLCSVGTANMDARSMCFDWEVSPFLFSPSVTGQLQGFFDADKEDCIILTDENYRKLYKCKQRFVGTIMRMFKGIL